MATNPFQANAGLKDMVDELDSIQNYRQFKQWRSSFLNAYESYLDESGSAPALKAYQTFRSNMTKFVAKLSTVEEFVQLGDLTPSKTTVKGRNALNEFSKTIGNIILEKEALIPAKSTEEKQRGYNKYHLGSVLIRDGFQELARLNECNDKLQVLKTGGLSGGVANKQQLDEIDSFNKQFGRLKDIMADLGLFEVMLKSWEFGEGDEFVFVDLKTGAVGVLPIKMCMDKGVVHVVKDKRGNDTGFKENMTNKEDLAALVGLVRETLKI